MSAAPSRSGSPAAALVVAENNNSIYAKEYPLNAIPQNLKSVEFPLFLKNDQSVSKVINNMCGGIYKINSAFRENLDYSTDKCLELYLNKNDKTIDGNNWDNNGDNSENDFFNEHPIIGKSDNDEKLLIKITITRKKKSQTDGDASTGTLLDNLRSCEAFKVQPLGVINKTIKFRYISDFQTILDNNKSAVEYNQSINSLDWDKIKTFVEDIPDEDPRPFEPLFNDKKKYYLPPPPKFSMVHLPFIYEYKKNPYSDSRGEDVRTSYLKSYQIQISSRSDVPEQPHQKLLDNLAIAKETGVYPKTNKESQFYEQLLKCVEHLENLFNKRPIWLKKHLEGIIVSDNETNNNNTAWGPILKFGLAVVSYRFLKGPWRNSYIKFGVDPYSSFSYAKYQTEFFKIEKKILDRLLYEKYKNEKKNVNDLVVTHHDYSSISPQCPKIYETDTKEWIDSRFYFDGTYIPWYLMIPVDLLLKESNIKEIYDKAVFLDKPNELTGWFHDLDLLKIRKIVKYELGCLAQNNDKFDKKIIEEYKKLRDVKATGPEITSTDIITDKRDNIRQSLDFNVTMNEKQMIDVVKKYENESLEEDDDNNNGIKTGVTDDNMVEDIGEDGDADEVQSDSSFTANNASYMEILEQISKMHPEISKYLKENVDGIIKGDLVDNIKY
ncbi:related to Transcription factor tau 95 kDa subunit [Saccharomycodes ludwigii]|uniref:Related to Transcription factor tau 95 kDa subunit n=1 Tax=Saccharomycodes ludwigii TaxID=36035 RepID=A0A376B6V7_9ASCO|nr:hypothetical protein SCDLUD_000544 [Saccharomycodes ludwigii]KAH3902945.1 hypothetical protein SCDLUD_000544 [Saccharomycodes ludwigii]SSD60425.1 related to Transcription factor tau 95 kDa subunit [Saccharomycodes ludwigii]